MIDRCGTVHSLRPSHVYIQILINGNCYLIISHWQVCPRFTQALIEHLLLKDTRCFSHLCERRAAKLTSRHVSILTSEKWYWDRELTSSDWKYRKTEYQGRQFYLHWLYNKTIRDFKMRSELPNIEPCDFEVSSFNCTAIDKQLCTNYVHLTNEINLFLPCIKINQYNNK